MKFGLSFFYLTLFILSLNILPLQALAVSPASILVNVAPQNPAPGEVVSISLNSYASNLDSVLISWSVDGKRISSGIGLKSFSVTAGEAGEETSVIVTVSLPDGSIDKRILVRPNVMMLLWQANDSYVPPFYKGKAMPTPDSEVKIVAMPEIKVGSQITSPKNMTYSWKRDYKNNPDGSGYGKNYFLYVNDYLEDSNNVTVNASTLDQKYSAQASIDVSTTDPKILFYRTDVTLGTDWDHALSNGYKIEGSDIIEAAPYFISPGDIRIPLLTWDWSINGSRVDVTGIRKNVIPLAVQAGVSGTAKIRLEINNLYKIFATSEEEIDVTF